MKRLATLAPALRSGANAGVSSQRSAVSCRRSAVGGLPPDDRPHEECGVLGIYVPGRDVARMTFFGLYALQHRGQESAGIATSDGHAAYIHKGMGLVAQVFK